ncbi:anthranilate phosphoribosyltransferase [Pontibacter sp. SGAir0037]|uniref:anthranilate phosphoribosyltransferase n=1 Tax=Pontibacter sp. SGAir0037 TaxID=2571030 RepID=UPI0010CCE6A4|nr:anthranilate phosphoribosyltransferase [Pontibacter sp. SGAir0037]QCR24852.1 anthranilate phosphoribosyltransferase [Pontibacter sp. SGAir0037]
MQALYTETDNPLVQGIKVIGIGKHGSKPLSKELITSIYTYLAEGEGVPIQKGTFYGALMAKGPTEEEKVLLYASGGDKSIPVAEHLYQLLCSDAPAELKEIGLKLLDKEFLSIGEAEKLGQFMYSDEPGEAFRGMAASMLRIRYETDEEYQGLLNAAEATYADQYRARPAGTRPAVVVQLAEPFDGVEHSYLITPLLAQFFQQAGYPAVVTMGRSGGPKLALNTLDLYQDMGCSFIENAGELAQTPPAFGWALDQQLLSVALDKWVDRRRLFFKRPFLATLEKVLNPLQAQVLVVSVFHLTYIEKMITLAAMAGFKGVMVMKRGLEGTLAPSIAKASGITCALIKADGTFITQSFEATQEEFTPFRADSDDVVEALHLQDNVALVRQFAAKGATTNQDFDKRVNLAFALYQKGLSWIEENMAYTR